jgi:ribosomal-protein-alanine N-acetyltransferase
MHQTIERIKLRTHIRWMIRRDMREVLAIESGSQERPWCEEEFLARLRQRNCIGMVAEHNEKVIGFMVYELHKGRLELINMAVDPGQFRRWVGTQMINRLKEKLSSHRRREIVAAVRETNLDMQLFLRSQGFLARKVHRRYFGDTDEDAFVMSFELE